MNQYFSNVIHNYKFAILWQVVKNMKNDSIQGYVNLILNLHVSKLIETLVK